MANIREFSNPLAGVREVSKRSLLMLEVLSIRLSEDAESK